LIARMWHGRTPTAKADEYLALLRSKALPDYRSKPGNLAAHILRRKEGDVTHFITLTFWPSLQAIQDFTGPDVNRAVYYPEDTNFLLEFEPTVEHWELHW